VTVLGSRKVGKTALVHFMTNLSPYGTGYVVTSTCALGDAIIRCRGMTMNLLQPTNESEMRHLKLDHPHEGIGVCSVAVSDTTRRRTPRRKQFAKL